MTAPHRKIAEEDQMRADLYGLLSALLARPPSGDLLRQCAGLSGDDTPMGQAIGTLRTLSGKMSPGAVEREFNALFIGLARGELLPFASYYMTGFLNEKPLARLRQDMARLHITRAPSVFEPEDSIASVMEMMSGLIVGRFGAPQSLAGQREFFNAHVAPWAAHFFTDLAEAKGSVFYAPIGTLGQIFVTMETDAFKMTGG